MTETTQPPRGKGRPTPKRSDKEKARRKPVVNPRATATKADREARRARRKQIREALVTNDERYYPRIHQGPERALVRDVIDSRKSVGWLAFPAWALGLLLTLTQVPAAQAAGTLLFPVAIGLLVADTVGAARAVRRAVAARFPDGTKDRPKSLVWYGIARNTQFRRQRMPSPRVARGDDLPA